MDDENPKDYNLAQDMRIVNADIGYEHSKIYFLNYDNLDIQKVLDKKAAFRVLITNDLPFQYIYEIKGDNQKKSLQFESKLERRLQNLPNFPVLYLLQIK